MAKRWRAKKGKQYWTIVGFTTVGLYTAMSIDDRDKWDLANWKSGNYFKTEKEADTMLIKIQQLLNPELKPRIVVHLCDSGMYGDKK